MLWDLLLGLTTCELAEFFRRAEAAPRLSRRGSLYNDELASDSGRHAGLTLFRNPELGCQAGHSRPRRRISDCDFTCVGLELTPAGIVKAAEAPVERAGDWNIVHRIYSTVIALLALAIVVLLFLRYSGSQSAPGGASAEKSIAVLPFENLSEDKDNVYFADGMQDDLLTNLAKIQDLTVISRTSVMKFRRSRHSVTSGKSGSR